MNPQEFMKCGERYTRFDRAHCGFIESLSAPCRSISLIIAVKKGNYYRILKEFSLRICTRCTLDCRDTPEIMISLVTFLNERNLESAASTQDAFYVKLNISSKRLSRAIPRPRDIFTAIAEIQSLFNIWKENFSVSGTNGNQRRNLCRIP